MGYWDDVTSQSVSNAQDGFAQFQVGDNEAYIKLVKERVSKNGNKMLEITFANNEGTEIKHWIVEGEYKLSKLKQLYVAFGIPFANRDIHSWQGKRGIVVCKQGQPNSNGNIYSEVSFLKPLPGSNTNQPTNAQRNQPAQQSNREPDQDYPPDDGFMDDIPF